MSPTQSTFTVLAAALIGVAPLACDAKSTPATPAASAQAAAPAGYVLVEEDLVMMTVDQPQAHFLAAERDLAQKDPKGAAAELRIAAGYMDMQADRGQGEAKQKVTEAAENVRKLAGTLGGTTADTKAMKQCLAEAEMALATHYQGKASDELAHGKPVMAGHDLQAAADAVDGGLAWSGRQPPAAEVKAVADTRELAARLILPGVDEAPPKAGEAQKAAAKEGGEAAVPKDAGKTVQTLGDTIGMCAQKVETAAKT
jgi:hypothetical protein